MEREMKEFSSNPKIKALKLVSVLLMATFLQAGIAHSEGGLGGALGGALGGLGGALGGGGSGGSSGGTSGGGSVGGALGRVGDAVGGLTGGLGNTVNGVTSKLKSSTTTTKLGTVSLNPDDQLGANANSKLINGINAQARLLNPDQLANLCMAAGGGDSGCGSGSTTQVRATLNANLNNLSSGQLLSLCAGVGGGCGGSAAIPGGGIGGDPVRGGGGNGAGLGGMSRGEVVAYKKRCVSVLRSPQRYESDIVSLCRLIKRQRV
jgi:hypothetical protein